MRSPPMQHECVSLDLVLTREDTSGRNPPFVAQIKNQAS